MFFIIILLQLETVGDDIDDNEESGRAQPYWATGNGQLPDVWYTRPVVVMVFSFQGKVVVDAVWESLRADGDGDILPSSWWSQAGIWNMRVKK